MGRVWQAQFSSSRKSKQWKGKQLCSDAATYLQAAPTALGWAREFSPTLYVGQIQFKDDCPTLNRSNSFGRTDPASGHGLIAFVSPIPGPCITLLQLRSWNSSALRSLGVCSSSDNTFREGSATGGWCNQAGKKPTGSVLHLKVVSAVQTSAPLTCARTRLVHPS